MKKIYSTLLLILVIALSTPVKAQLPSELQNKLQRTLDSICTKYKVKGATASVLYPGAGTWNGTSGVSYDNNNVTTDMLFGMGSNTKTFMSALLLKMQEQNLLDLDDSIGTWIRNKPNINGSVTIRQCLNHTSGIADYLQNASVNDSIDNNPGKIWQPEELLALAQAPDFAPGASWNYSNTNYVIAGIIIRTVLNKPVPQALREMILEPAGLNNTYFYGEGNSASLMPHQWTMRITGTNLTDLNTMTPNLIGNLFSMATTAGAMVSTAEDNVKFWHKLTTGQIINSASLKEMRTYVNIGGNDGYGLGIFFYSKGLNNRSFYSHGGTFFGFINENIADTTSGVCISVMTNQDSMNNNGILGTIIRAMHRVTIQMPVGFKESVYNSRNLVIYPNPATNMIRIESGDEQIDNGTVTIYDLAGKQQQCSPIGYERTCTVADLTPGFYTVQVSTAKGELVHIQKLQIIK